MGIKHSSSADGSFSGTGATNWNADHVITGDLDFGGFSLTNVSDLQVTDGTFPITLDPAAKRVTIGTGDGTSTGLHIGYFGSSGYGTIHSTAITPGATNFSFLTGSTETQINAPVSNGTLYFSHANNVKMTMAGTAGAGPTITAGENSGAGTEISFTAPNGQIVSIQRLSELTTIAAAATTDTTIQMPAGAVVLAVDVRVTVVIPTATNFTVGDSGSAARFNTGASVAVAAGTTNAGTKAGAYYNASALSVRITPDVQPADNSGRVRVTIHYYLITPATS